MVVFGPFSPHWLYSVHISPNLSTLVHICPIQSILPTLVLFGPILSISSTSILFGPLGPLGHIQSIFPTLVLFSPLRSTLFEFSPFNLHWLYSVQFGSIQSNLVLFGPLWFYLVFFLVHCIHFSPLQSYSGHLVCFGHIWSIFSTMVLFSLLRSIRSYLAQLDLIRSTVFVFGPFCHSPSI